jgi:hypothetical protein
MLKQRERLLKVEQDILSEKCAEIDKFMDRSLVSKSFDMSKRIESPIKTEIETMPDFQEANRLKSKTPKKLNPRKQSFD